MNRAGSDFKVVPLFTVFALLLSLLSYSRLGSPPPSLTFPQRIVPSLVCPDLNDAKTFMRGFVKVKQMCLRVC